MLVYTPETKFHQNPFGIRLVVSFFLDYLTLKDGTNRLSRNVGKGLPLDAA
jgi:hypothetical protein